MGQYYTTAARNALLFRELDRILAAFDEDNIPVVVKWQSVVSDEFGGERLERHWIPKE